MYSKISKEEDDEMAENWQKDADGILIFVSPLADIHTTTHMNRRTVDRFILCLRRRTTCPVRTRSQAKSTRCIRMVS